MPIYEYACKSCEHVFDVLQKMTDDPLTYCPECGAPELRKLVSAPSFRLKGGGWYETDFKTGDKRNVVESGDGKDKSGDKKDEAGGKKDKAGDKAEATAKKSKADGSPATGGDTSS